MKAKVTRKWVAGYYTCIGVGYCGMQYLLRFQNASFYTAGLYGWNFDVFTFGDYAITTGYRNMIHHVDTLPYEEYDEKARKIVCDNTLSYEEQKEKVNALLAEYLENTDSSQESTTATLCSSSIISNASISFSCAITSDWS